MAADFAIAQGEIDEFEVKVLKAEFAEMFAATGIDAEEAEEASRRFA